MADNSTIARFTAKDETKPAIDSAVRGMQRMQNASQQANTAIDRAARQSRQGIAQFSYQVQDVAVQLQGGQSPFIVLAQQGSQLASIFGAGGAVFGAIVAVGAGIATTLVPELFNSNLALENLNKTTEESKKLFKELEGGVIGLSDSLLRMAQASRSAAVIELDKRRREAVDALTAGQAEILQKTTEFNELMARASNQVAPLAEGSIAGLSKIYGITEESMRSLQAFSKDAMNGSVEQIEAFLAALSEVQTQEGVTKRFNELAESLSGLLVASINSKNEIVNADKALSDLDGMIAASTETIDTAATSVEKMIAAFQKQNQTYGLSSTAIAVYEAQLAKATPQQQAQIAMLAWEIEKRELAAAALNTHKKEQKDLNEERLREAKIIEDMFAREDKATEEHYKKQADAMKIIEDGRVSGLSGADAIAAEYDEKIRAQYEALKQMQWLETEHADVLIRLNQEKSAAIKKALYDEDMARKQMALSQISTMQGMAQGISDALEQGTAAQKAAFVVSQALAVAQSIISANLAANQVLADPLLPTAMKGPMSFAIRALGYMNAGIIAGQTVASFEGGGFTGYGARAGGIDGRGGMPAIVHPNESIIDHTKGGGGINVNITIQANDARGFDELLNKRRGMIASMVQSSLNNMGRTI